MWQTYYIYYVDWTVEPVWLDASEVAALLVALRARWLCLQKTAEVFGAVGIVRGIYKKVKQPIENCVGADICDL